MRDAFAAALTRAAAADERIVLVLADLGVGVFDEFERQAPGRLVNAGIAEQAMVGVASGLAQAGKRPVAYSIAPFITSRAHDQVRVDVAAGAVSFRYRDGTQNNGVAVADAVAEIVAAVRERR